MEDLKKITKAELVEFAKTFYKDNYVIVYKRQGENKELVKVEKPPITPVELNREKQSEFVKLFNKLETESIKPLFIDYKDKLKVSTLSNGLKMNHIDNPDNDLINLYFYFRFRK